MPARSETGRMAVRDRYADVCRFVESKRPLIVDGGAHRGETVERFLRLFDSPEIHAFEPIPELGEHLLRRYGANSAVTVHACALGAKDATVTFNVARNLVSSSVLQPSGICNQYHGKDTDVVQTVSVPAVRLDQLFCDRDIDVLKLDLQGYELEALKGASSILQRVRVVVTEIEFVPIYDGQPLFGDVDYFLRAQGFQLFNLYDLYTQPDGQLTAGDALYVNGTIY